MVCVICGYAYDTLYPRWYETVDMPEAVCNSSKFIITFGIAAQFDDNDKFISADVCVCKNCMPKLLKKSKFMESKGNDETADD